MTAAPVDFGGNLWDERADGDRRSPHMAAVLAEVDRRKTGRRSTDVGESTGRQSRAASRVAAACLGKGTAAASPQAAHVTGPAVARRPAT